MAAAARQSAFTVVAPLARAEAVDELSALVARFDPCLGLESGGRIPFRELPGLHYCSWSVIREDPGAPPGAYLAFEGNVDGDVRSFLEALAALAGDALREVYAFCEGVGPDTSLVDYWLDHDRGPGTWYVAWRGRALDEIQREEHLQEQIQEFLDSLPDLKSLAPRELRAAIQAHVSNDTALARWAQDPPVTPFLQRVVGPLVDGIRLSPATRPVLYALGLVVLAGIFGLFVGPTLTALSRGLAVAAAVGFALYWLAQRHVRRLEDAEPPGLAPELADVERLRLTTEREDLHLQNHLCLRNVVKAGAFRMGILRLALFVIGLLHRVYFNRGKLGGIPTIHFARWVLLPERRELLFFSNYDGSFEGYLGDFIDGASIGLNSIWTNTHTYPPTKGLFRGGAENEQRFKVFARNAQHRTLAWYAAYPHLSVQNVEHNARIREGLFATMRSDAEVDAWLRRF
jgi:hypothetical protein